jgi:hypothetical protein
MLATFELIANNQVEIFEGLLHCKINKNIYFLDTNILIVYVKNLVEIHVVWATWVVSNCTPRLPALINSIKLNRILNFSHYNSVLIENVSYSESETKCFEACFSLSKFICNECLITPIGTKKKDSPLKFRVILIVSPLLNANMTTKLPYHTPMVD